MVRFLDYKNEKLPFRVSYYALKMLKAELGKTLSMLKEEDFEAYEILLFYSLKQGFKVVDKVFPFTKDDMVDILDECFFEFMKLIPEFFSTVEAEVTPTTEIEVQELAAKKSTELTLTHPQEQP